MSGESEKLLQRIVVALENIDKHLKKFVEEGITIFEHQDGNETKN